MGIKNKLKDHYRFYSGRYQNAFLDYHVNLQPRAKGRAYQKLHGLIQSGDEQYKLIIKQIVALSDHFAEWPVASPEGDNHQPYWNNGFLPGLDMVALYTFLNHFMPKQYLEIGSGNSTMVAHQSIKRNKLATRIKSVDPFPRASIDLLSNEIDRRSLENVNVEELVDSLHPGDILFFDGSHRSFANSDVTVFFTEVLPFLKSGVVVQIHDIYLPYDYPQFMCDRYYNEQYLLSTMLLSDPGGWEIIWPGFYISQSPGLNSKILPLWEKLELPAIETHGGSFWLRKV